VLIINDEISQLTVIAYTLEILDLGIMWMCSVSVTFNNEVSQLLRANSFQVAVFEL